MTPLPAEPAGRLPQRLSGSISIARVLCVFGVIYVHAWTGLTGDQLRALAGTGQDMLRWSLMEFLGRSAVPLLSIVSGWLLANSTRRPPYRRFLAGKARAILLPMVLWNALSILIVSGAAYAGILQAPTIRSLWWLADELLCLATPNDINVQTAFLRDLFLCMAAAPLLLRAHGRWLVAGMAVLAVWAVAGWYFPLLLRPSIPLFFMLGILIRRGELAERLATVNPIVALVPFLLVGAAKIVLEVQPAEVEHSLVHVIAAVDLLLRPAAALLFWRAAWLLAGSAAAERLIGLERYVFFVFCAHLILIWLGGPLIGGLAGPLGSPAYPLFLLLQPVLAFAGGIAVARALGAIAPGAADLLSGGRVSREPALPVTGRKGTSPMKCRSA